MAKSHELPAFITDTKHSVIHIEPTPRLSVEYIDPERGPRKQSFDMNDREGRRFFERFVTWCLRKDVAFTGRIEK